MSVACLIGIKRRAARRATLDEPSTQLRRSGRQAPQLDVNDRSRED